MQGFFIQVILAHTTTSTYFFVYAYNLEPFHPSSFFLLQRMRSFRRVTVVFLLLSLLFAGFSAVTTQEVLRKRTLPPTASQKSLEWLENDKQTERSTRIKLVYEKAKRAAFAGGMYGAIAGGFQVLSLMWLRTVINYQYRYGCSMQEAFQALFKQGGIQRFYKGVTYAIIQNPLSKFGSVAANEASRVLIDQTIPLSPVYTSALGTLLSVIWRVLIVPLETCKTVLQVDGSKGFEKLLTKIKQGNLFVLYQGTSATIASTFLSHYPWFLVYHWLDRLVPTDNHLRTYTVLRHGSIGFVATAFSDTVSNFLRIVKTMKQTLAATEHITVSYEEIIVQLYKTGGLSSLVTRGLGTRIIANGLQNFIFTVVWKLLPLYIDSRNKRKDSESISIAEEETVDNTEES